MFPKSVTFALFLFVSNHVVYASCYDVFNVGPFEADRLRIQSILKKTGAPPKCHLMVSPALGELSHVAFEGGTWLDFLVMLATEHHVKIDRLRDYTRLYKQSESRLTWPMMHKTIMLHHQKPSWVIEKLQPQKKTLEEAKMRADDQNALLMLDAPINQMESLVASVVSLDQKKLNYHIEVKVIVLRDSNHLNSGLMWENKSGAFFAWPRTALAPSAWLVSVVDHWLWSQVESDESAVVVARPHLRVVEGEDALVQSSDDPFVSKTARSVQGDTREALEPFHLSLAVKPIALPNSRVRLFFDLEQNQVSRYLGHSQVMKQSHHVKMVTEVALEDLIVVGGIEYQKSIERSQHRWRPNWLSKLFKRKEASLGKQKLLLLMRVHKA